jgi:hypothetical protein
MFSSFFFSIPRSSQDNPLTHLKKEIKQDARDWITNLAKERHEYIALYKQAIDTLRVCQQELWKLYHNEDIKAVVKVQCLLGLVNCNLTLPVYMMQCQ